MKSERLLNSDLELDHGASGRHQQRQQQSTDEAIALDSIDLEHDAVYFGADSSPRSFSGYLSEDLEDEEIIEYIRRSNRSLYDRLWNTPQEQPGQEVAPTATEQPEVSDGAGDVSPPTYVKKKLYSRTETTSNPSKKSLARRSTSSALPTSPDPISSLGSCGNDLLLTPCGSDSVLRPALTLSRSKKELQQDLLLLQQRRYIQSLLLNDHVLVLQKMPPAEAKVRSRSCDHPLCIYRHGIPSGVYRLSLESKKTLEKATATTDRYYSPKKEDSGKYLKVRSTNSRGFYCLTCIEDLFSGVGMLDDDYTASAVDQRGSMTPDDPTSAIMSVDGSSDDDLGLRALILQAAEKLMPGACLVQDARVRLQEKLARDTANVDIFDDFGRQLAVGLNEHASPAPPASAGDELQVMVSTPFPSNSDDTVLLRNTKNLEIETTLYALHQTTYRREVRQLSPSSSNCELPSLRISRPTYLPQLQERYKKQGLGKWNWRVYRSSLPVTHLQDDNASSITINMDNANSDQSVAPIERFCYCRKPDDHKGMINCSAEFCVTGWVHLKCSGLPRLPMRDETWFCNECSTLFGPGTFDPGLKLTPENDAKSTRVLRSNVRAASNLVHRVESGNETSDGLSTDDTSLNLSDDEVGDPTYTVPVTPRRQNKRVASMTFTPYEFLDGVGDGKQDARGPAASEETTTINTNIPVSPTSIKWEPKIAKLSLTRTKRPSTLSLQDPDGPMTPKKRLRRTSSPPPPITPPSRHTRTSFGHLAHFIYPETRTSAAALSNPQIVALEKWKSIHLHSPLTGIIQSSRPKAATSPSSNEKIQHPSARPGASLNIATLEVGGAVIDLPAIHGKKLSQILTEVDNTVEEELRRQDATGWEQGVHAREEAVKTGKAKGSRMDEQNGLTSPKAANEVRKRISRSFSASKG